MLALVNIRTQMGEVDENIGETWKLMRIV